MHLERKKDLSVYFLVKDLFNDYGFISVHDGYPETELEIPSIAVESKTLEPIKWELGNNNRVPFRIWYIDIYATSKAQRDEAGYLLLDTLEECIPVYDYDEGLPPNVEPTNIGCLEVGDIRMDIIKVVPEFTSKMYYRATISFTANYNQL